MVIIDYEILPLDRLVSPLWKSRKGVDLSAVSEMDLRTSISGAGSCSRWMAPKIGRYWGSMPLLDFAQSMRFLADSIEANGTVSIGFTEHRTVVPITIEGDLVEIREPHVDRVLRCRMEDLIAAAEGFVEKVTSQLAVNHPTIVENQFFSALRRA